MDPRSIFPAATYERFRQVKATCDPTGMFVAGATGSDVDDRSAAQGDGDGPEEPRLHLRPRPDPVVAPAPAQLEPSRLVRATAPGLVGPPARTAGRTLAGVGPPWLDGRFYVVSGTGTFKSRNLAGAEPRCAISLSLPDIDVVVRGVPPPKSDR